MDLNDILIYDGRRYVVVGFDPMSVRPQRVYLRDVNSGEEVTRLYEDLMGSVRDVARSQQARSCATTPHRAPNEHRRVEQPNDADGAYPACRGYYPGHEHEEAD